MLTKDQVERALPATLRGMATQEYTDKINNIVSDPIVAQEVRDNFVSYASVLKDGKYRTEDYLKAVAYVTFKLMGYTNLDAYTNTFPQRYQDLVAKGTDSKTIAAYVSMYNKGKLVQLILEQTLTPVWILNQEAYQKAINVQVDLMTNANSEKVRSDAANSILTHLAKPKDATVSVDLTVKQDTGMTELKDLLRNLAQQQIKTIEGGTSAREIAGQVLIPKPNDDMKEVKEKPSRVFD